MATTDTKQQLKDLLRELFQLNNTDLDFGIYRIMNIKSKEVENFITKDLDEKVESVKSKILDRQSGDIKAELEEAKTKLEKDFQVNFQQDGDIEAKANQYGQLALFLEPFNKFKTAKEKLDNIRVSEDTEKSIYNELYRFFERYYEGGDFISKPRAGKNNYMIPYEGEEVKLYWANYDQYYIKTGDNFKNYLFNNQSADPKTFTQIEFRILDADIAMNNNKEEKGRLFVPIEEPFEWIEEERKLLLKDGGTLYKDLESTLQTLSKSYSLFIVSNCQCGYIETFLEYHKLSKYFKDFECAGNTRLAKGENIKSVMKRNNLVHPVYVGDTQGDCDAAKLANIPFVFASYGFGKVDGYDYVIKEISEMVGATHVASGKLRIGR